MRIAKAYCALVQSAANTATTAGSSSTTSQQSGNTAPPHEYIAGCILREMLGQLFAAELLPAMVGGSYGNDIARQITESGIDQALPRHMQLLTEQMEAHNAAFSSSGKDNGSHSTNTGSSPAITAPNPSPLQDQQQQQQQHDKEEEEDDSGPDLQTQAFLALVLYNLLNECWQEGGFFFSLTPCTPIVLRMALASFQYVSNMQQPYAAAATAAAKDAAPEAAADANNALWDAAEDALRKVMIGSCVDLEVDGALPSGFTACPFSLQTCCLASVLEVYNVMILLHSGIPQTSSSSSGSSGGFSSDRQ